MIREREDDIFPDHSTTATSQVAGFFKDRNVFITGATGFVGKVVLEKLLRSCQVRTVYVLMRPKEGRNSESRLDELFSGQVFDRLKSTQRSVLKKVVPICGDITLNGLGISKSDTDMLCKKVSVVIHSAATVRFDEPLKVSVDMNLVATEKIIELCQQMTEISALIHVSTAYSFCNREVIEEVVYPEKVHPKRVVEISQWMDTDLVDCILPKLMDGRPTTYHYTKALAESCLMEKSGSLPIAIVRPSIVTASYKEPFPGWVDGMNGPTTFIIATGRGLLRTMLVYKNSAVDWVPVDVLANLILTACWELGTNKSKTIRVYNCTSGDLNRITWQDIQRTAYPIITRHPSIKAMRYPGGSFKSNRLLNTISVKLEHSLPAKIIDALASMIGYKTEFGSMVTRMERAAGYLDYFTTKQWKFHSKNFVDLMDKQNSIDKKLFGFDLGSIEWSPYLENYVLGIRKHILKENESSLPAARRKLARLYYSELIAKCAVLFGFIYLILTKTSLSQHLMWSLIGLAFQIMPYLPKSWIRAIGRAMGQ